MISNLFLCILSICHHIYLALFLSLIWRLFANQSTWQIYWSLHQTAQVFWSGGRTQRKATDVSLCERQIMCEQQKMSTSALAERNANFAAISLVQENLAVHPTGLITAKSRRWNWLQWANFHLWWSLALWRSAFFRGWIMFFFFSLSAADKPFTGVLFFRFADVTAVS